MSDARSAWIILSTTMAVLGLLVTQTLGFNFQWIIGLVFMIDLIINFFWNIKSNCLNGSMRIYGLVKI